MNGHSLEVSQAILEDVPGIARLLRFYSEADLLLPRSEGDIYNSLRDFFVVRKDKEIIACGALLIYTKDLGEVRSLAVDLDHQGLGLGWALVSRIEQEARQLGLSKLMALTYVENFFVKMDFEVVEMTVLPEKVWSACINCHKFQNCDEIAVLKYLTQ